MSLRFTFNTLCVLTTIGFVLGFVVGVHAAGVG